MAKKETKKDTSFPHSAEIEKVIGYVFKDKSLLAQAFTRTSFCNEVNPTSGVKYQSSEVLEFFGDSVLSAAIITLLLESSAERYEGGIRTQLGEGDFSNIKSKLSDKKNLSKSTHALGLERFLRMGEGDKKLKINEEPSVREDLYESIIGAVYIDSGMNLAKVISVVKETLDLTLYNTKAAPIQSAKNALQEWCQDKKRRLPPPQYKTLGKEGPDHKTAYEVGCYVDGKLIASGKGKNEKLAGAAAAEAALKILEKKEAPPEQSKKAPEQKPEVGIKAQSGEAKAPKAQLTKLTAKANAKAEADRKKESDSREKALSDSFSMRLKAYAKAKGLLSPAFVDLGMQKENGKIVHRVECRLKDKARIARADTRENAKEEAARILLEELLPKGAPSKGAKGAKAAEKNPKGAKAQKKKAGAGAPQAKTKNK